MKIPRAKAVCHPHHSQERSLSGALERLRESGHKLTRPRQSLLKVIVDFSGPFSTDDLFHLAKKSMRGQKCDLVTVYRSVAKFAEIGLLSRVDFGDGIIRYELNAPNGAHHHHVVCVHCHKVEPLGFCELTELDNQERKLSQKGYSQISHRLEFFGICPDCDGKGEPGPRP